MAYPDDRMDALSGALARMLRKQDEVEQRLARIESAMGLAAQVAAEAAPIPVTPIEQTPPPVPPVAASVDAPPPLPEPEPKPRELETSIGLTLVNRIGAITLVLGVGFFFKWAVDNNWIGPAGRVGLGILAGLAALGLADFLWRRNQRIFAQGVTATGIAILYLAFYAAYDFYHIIAQSLAFLLMVLATATAAALATRYQAIAIAALGLLGGFLTPILVSSGEDRPWFLFTYILILSLGAMALSKTQNWPALEILSFAGTAILYAAWLTEKNPEGRLVAVVFALVYYGLFAASRFLPIFVLAQILAPAALMVIYPHAVGTFLVLSLVLALAGLVVADHRGWQLAVGSAFVAFWAITGAWMTELPAPRPLGMLFLALTGAFALFQLWTPWWVFQRERSTRPAELALLGVNGAVYFGASYYLLDHDYHAWMGLFAVAVAGIQLALAWLLFRNIRERDRDLRPVLISAGAALFFLTLAAPIQFTAWRITMAWALEGAALTWIGRRANYPRMTITGAVVFVLVLTRLVDIDAWIFPTPAEYQLLFNARFLTFLIAAAALFLSAWWSRENRALALAHYLGGHFVLLWTLTQEILGWVGRATPNLNRLSAETISVSILYASYAVALVAIGVAVRMALHRVCGLVLIGFVALKLYLFDVWQLDRIYRISAFVALGILLLSTSFLYSHFRALIESWWKDETPAS